MASPEAKARRKARRKAAKAEKSSGPKTVVVNVQTQQKGGGKQHNKKKKPHTQNIQKRMGNCLLAECIALPGNTPGFRMPTTDAPRTSVSSSRDQYTVTTPNTTPLNWNTGDLIVAFFGQPGRLAYVYQLMSPTNYTCQFGGINANFSTNWTIMPASVSGNSFYNMYWPLEGATATGVSGCHGGNMAVGQAKNNSYLFMNAGDSMWIGATTAWTSTCVGQMGFELMQWVASEGEPVAVQQNNLSLVANQLGAQALFNISDAGYYAVVFVGAYITSGTISSSNNSIQMEFKALSSLGWSQKSMLDLDSRNAGDPVMGQDCRTVAASMLLTNTSSIMNRQGTVLAARTKFDDFTAMTPVILARMAEKYTGDAAKGVYTFKEFTAVSEIFSGVTTSSNAIMFDLDVDDYIHFVQISCPTVSTQPNTYTMSFDVCLEFRADTSRYQKDVSKFSYQDLIASRRLLNSNPVWFYENPMHMADIYGFIKHGAQKVWRGAVASAPYIAKAAAVYDPPGAAGYEMLASLLRRM